MKHKGVHNVTGFRDHTVYKGHQIFLYKRAQIFAADLWGAFKGQRYGEFKDIESVTMFADYIVPAVLEQLGVLKFSPSLANMIESNIEIISGSEEEVELRACSVHAVEEIRELIHRKSGKQVKFCCLILQLRCRAISDVTSMIYYKILIPYVLSSTSATILPG